MLKLDGNMSFTGLVVILLLHVSVTYTRSVEEYSTIKNILDQVEVDLDRLVKDATVEKNYGLSEVDIDEKLGVAETKQRDAGTGGTGLSEVDIDEKLGVTETIQGDAGTGGKDEILTEVEINARQGLKDDIILVDDRKRGAGQRVQKWPVANGVLCIPYAFDTSVSSATRVKIEAAIKNMNDAVDCHDAPWKPLGQCPNNGHYVKFINGLGCYSYIGKINAREGYQPISIGVRARTTCARLGIIVHEMMHCMGFYHEQSRPDRDLYVTINLGNIRAGVQSNFQKQSFTNIVQMNSPYDYLSLMHYGNKDFAIDRTKYTITTTDPAYQDKIGQRSGLSTEDKYQLNVYYGCQEVRTTTSIPTTTLTATSTSRPTTTTTTTTTRPTTTSTSRPTTTSTSRPTTTSTSRPTTTTTTTRPTTTTTTSKPITTTTLKPTTATTTTSKPTTTTSIPTTTSTSKPATTTTSKPTTTTTAETTTVAPSVLLSSCFSKDEDYTCNRCHRNYLWKYVGCRDKTKCRNWWCRYESWAKRNCALTCDHCKADQEEYLLLKNPRYRRRRRRRRRRYGIVQSLTSQATVEEIGNCRCRNGQCELTNVCVEVALAVSISNTNRPADLMVYTRSFEESDKYGECRRRRFTCLKGPLRLSVNATSGMFESHFINMEIECKGLNVVMVAVSGDNIVKLKNIWVHHGACTTAQSNQVTMVSNGQDCVDADAIESPTVEMKKSVQMELEDVSEKLLELKKLF